MDAHDRIADPFVALPGQQGEGLGMGQPLVVEASSSHDSSGSTGSGSWPGETSMWWSRSSSHSGLACSSSSAPRNLIAKSGMSDIDIW